MITSASVEFHRFVGSVGVCVLWEAFVCCGKYLCVVENTCVLRQLFVVIPIMASIKFLRIPQLTTHSAEAHS